MRRKLYFKDHYSLKYHSVWEYFRTRQTDNKLYMLISYITKTKNNRTTIIGFIGEERTKYE